MLIVTIDEVPSSDLSTRHALYRLIISEAAISPNGARADYNVSLHEARPDTAHTPARAVRLIGFDTTRSTPALVMAALQEILTRSPI